MFDREVTLTGHYVVQKLSAHTPVGFVVGIDFEIDFRLVDC